MMIPERLSYKQDFYKGPEEKTSAGERNVCSICRIQHAFYFVKIKMERFFDFSGTLPIGPR